MKARHIAYCAAETALLIAVQFAFANVVGVELITVFLLCFCYVFGVRCGVLTATAFSLLRCFLFSFTPAVMVLYLVYYNLFAVVFGIAGKKKMPALLCPLLLGLIATGCAVFAIVGVPVSALYRERITIMLWVLFAVMSALIIFYTVLLVLHRDERGRQIASVTALAAFMTVLFTLLDDIIEPLFFGWSPDAALGYFYTSFTAMLPQTVCAAVSVFFLFYPIKKIFVKIGGTE